MREPNATPVQKSNNVTSHKPNNTDPHRLTNIVAHKSKKADSMRHLAIQQQDLPTLPAIIPFPPPTEPTTTPPSCVDCSFVTCKYYPNAGDDKDYGDNNITTMTTITAS